MVNHGMANYPVAGWQHALVEQCRRWTLAAGSCSATVLALMLVFSPYSSAASGAGGGISHIIPPIEHVVGPTGRGVVPDPCAFQPTMQQAGGYWPWHGWLYAHDYGQLCRYRNADIRLERLPPSARRVVFIGDSITEIWKQEDPAFFTDGRIDRGISGQTTSQMLVRFRQDVVDLHPRVVQIMGGTNDIAGNTGDTTLEAIENNLTSMIDLAKANGIAVILASVPPATQFPWHKGIEPADTIRELNQWIRNYAVAHNCVYADYYDALRTKAGGMKPGLSLDGVHPSRKGLAVMDAIATRSIKAALHGS